MAHPKLPRTPQADPTLPYLLAAMAKCHVETAEKAIALGIESLRPMTRARLRPAMVKLGLLPAETEGEPRR
jgi:hypothetical protein